MNADGCLSSPSVSLCGCLSTCGWGCHRSKQTTSRIAGSSWALPGDLFSLGTGRVQLALGAGGGALTCVTPLRVLCRSLPLVPLHPLRFVFGLPAAGHGSTNCVMYLCCKQLRTRDCKNCLIFLYTITEPIIELSTEMKVWLGLRPCTGRRSPQDSPDRSSVLF